MILYRQKVHGEAFWGWDNGLVLQVERSSFWCPKRKDFDVVGIIGCDER